ncbi:MAG TPA: hypothetical protein VGG33_03675 [Polyangia bacterium]
MRRLLVMKVVRHVVLGLFAVGVVGACAKKEDDEMTEAEFCQEYARHECAAIAPLCGFAPASCEPTRFNECQNRIVVWRNSTSGARPFRPANVPACIAKVDEAYSKLPITGPVLQVLNDTCARVFQGSAKALQPCGVDLDCEGNLICDKRLCAERKAVAAGAFCANPGEVCVATESCKAAATSSVLQCSPKQAAGAACTATDPCIDALRCAGTCLEKVATGGACAQNADCQSGYCSQFSLRCSVGLSFAENSDSCRAYMGSPIPDAATDTTDQPG